MVKRGFVKLVAGILLLVAGMGDVWGQQVSVSPVSPAFRKWQKAREFRAKKKALSQTNADTRRSINAYTRTPVGSVSNVDGLTAAEEYVAGTDPNDPNSTLKANIEMVDGKPVITYTPDLLDERKYVTFGKKELDDPDEPWVEVRAGAEADYNFFKVTVEMK